MIDCNPAMTAKQFGTHFQRIKCWKDTKMRVSNEGLQSPPSVKTKYVPNVLPQTEHKTVVKVDDMDSLDCGLLYQSQGFNPVVLNLADNQLPGGYVELGSGAQEESLFRRTSLHNTLQLKMYPIEDDEGIYSPDVHVIKASEAHGWANYSDEHIISFISVPGIKCPPCLYDKTTQQPRLTQKDERRLETKVRNILQIAAVNGHDCVVLGALGCGAWKCPPDHVASIFSRVLAEYHCTFKLVVFAIMQYAGDTHRAVGVTNFHTFQDVFQN